MANVLWLGIAALGLVGVIVVFAGRALASEAKTRTALCERLRAERGGDSRHVFSEEMLMAGVPTPLIDPLYNEVARSLEVYGFKTFPVRADDHLYRVYALGLPDLHNDFMDGDLREVVRNVVRQNGFDLVFSEGELRDQLATLLTVRDLGRWVADIPPAMQTARG